MGERTLQNIKRKVRGDRFTNSFSMSLSFLSMSSLLHNTIILPEFGVYADINSSMRQKTRLRVASDFGERRESSISPTVNCKLNC